MKLKKNSLPTLIDTKIKNGERLAGDNFKKKKLKKWYNQEKEAYYETELSTGAIDPWYSYMRYINNKYFFSSIYPTRGKILFIGVADGEEAVDFIKKHKHWNVSFLESSPSYIKILKKKFPKTNIYRANTSGNFPISNNSFDVVCAFSVLHHIANVSHIIKEISRILKTDGKFFVREPCSSMGDWRSERSATPNERGIAKEWMLNKTRLNNLLAYKTPLPIIFEPINKFLVKSIGYNYISHKIIFIFDIIISKILSYNDYYWRDTFFKKFGPSSYIYFFKKNEKK
jgi:ubiquinone/menaquinone biosynthesis C-methylase UbiE